MIKNRLHLHLTNKINKDIYKLKDFWIGILFGGDRHSCCDKFLHLYLGDKLIGLSSFSLSGEKHNNTPEIVGFYILPEYRKQGYGKLLLEKSIKDFRRFTDKKLTMVVISNNMDKLLNKFKNDNLIIHKTSILI